MRFFNTRRLIAERETEIFQIEKAIQEIDAQSATFCRAQNSGSSCDRAMWQLGKIHQ